MAVPGFSSPAVALLFCKQYIMKKIFLLFSIAAILLFCSSRVSAQDYRFAMGLRLGNSTPTISSSVTGKYFVTDKNAIEGLISFGSKFGLGALLEIHRKLDVEGLSWFYGAGAYVGFADNNAYVGPQGVTGLDYKFAKVPLNLSLDWKPELDIVPAINFVPDAFAFSIRFTLK